MGVDPLRFAEVDYSSSEQNDFDGAHNAYDAIIYANRRAFAALKADGSIATWGEPESGGTNAPDVPTDNGYIKIYSNERAFAVLKADGSITTPPYHESPHATIDPSDLRTAKARAFE
jgi:hypothetical protein